MSKKKETNALEIITLYMGYILDHNAKPTSVYSFAKENKFEEAIFYQYFGSKKQFSIHFLKTQLQFWIKVKTIKRLILAISC